MIARDVTITLLIDPQRTVAKLAKQVNDLNPASDNPSTDYDQEPTFFIDISKQELEKVLEEHKIWGNTGGQQGRRANLERVNLVGADLHGVNLAEANLYQCNLSKANLQGASLAKANLLGAQMGGANLQKASLWEADLQGARMNLANLQEANLSRANLSNANLREADLQKANCTRAVLKEAQLSLANLQGTIMRRADLQNVTFHHAVLYEANFQEANLLGVKGLQIKQLRGANMSSAQLPAGIEDSDWLKHVEETSRKSSRVFLIKLMSCLYAWLVMFSVKDLYLISSEAIAPLPLIGTMIPFSSFFWFAPVVLLVIFLYFHLYLQRLWEDVAAFPAVFPDGKPLDKKVYPWLISGILRANMPYLRDAHLPFFGLQRVVTVLVVWCVVPITLAAFLFTYLVKHDALVTAMHLVLLSLSVWMSVAFYKNATATMQGRKRNPFRLKEWRTDGRTPKAAVMVLVTVVSWGLLFFGPVPLPTANLSTENLQGSDLRRVNLHGAKLDGANIRSVRLSGARLSRATLFSAQLDNANLNRADLTNADLRAATLIGANLANARLNLADLRGAQLEGANFTGASLMGARLDRAVLTDVSGLSYGQICEAHSILDAEIDAELVAQVTNHCVEVLMGTK